MVRKGVKLKLSKDGVYALVISAIKSGHTSRRAIEVHTRLRSSQVGAALSILTYTTNLIRIQEGQRSRWVLEIELETERDDTWMQTIWR